MKNENQYIIKTPALIYLCTLEGFHKTSELHCTINNFNSNLFLFKQLCQQQGWKKMSININTGIYPFTSICDTLLIASFKTYIYIFIKTYKTKPTSHQFDSLKSLLRDKYLIFSA